MLPNGLGSKPTGGHHHRVRGRKKLPTKQEGRAILDNLRDDRSHLPFFFHSLPWNESGDGLFPKDLDMNVALGREHALLDFARNPDGSPLFKTCVLLFEHAVPPYWKPLFSGARLLGNVHPAVACRVRDHKHPCHPLSPVSLPRLAGSPYRQPSLPGYS